MRKEIIVNIKDNLRRLDYYNILENDKKAVNAWNILSPWQVSKKRKNKALKRKITWYTKSFAKKASIVCLIVSLIFIWWAKIYAYSDSVRVNNSEKLITVYPEQVKEMVKRWYSKTKILDLLALKTMECNRYDWMCYWIKNRDLWPFQINMIHKEAYKHSLLLMKQNKRAELFLYQLDFASDMYDRFNANFCWYHIFKQINKKYSNRKHFRCIAYSYNWSPRYKYAYDNIGWLKRAKVKMYVNSLFYNKG